MALPNLLLLGVPRVALLSLVSPGALGGAGPQSPPAQPTISEIFPFRMHRQEQTNWCWAAVALSVFQHWEISRPFIVRLARRLYFACARLFRPSAAGRWTQCELVNDTLHLGACCRTGGDDQCNRPWFLHEVLRVTGTLRQFVSGAAVHHVALTEVRACAPLGVRVGWIGGGGHFIVVHGYAQTATGKIFFQVEDPWYGPSVWDTTTMYRLSGTWTHHYLTKP